MERTLTITLGNHGKAKGTVGWLISNATEFHVGRTQSGTPAAWLRFGDGTEPICLAIQNPYQCDPGYPESRDIGILQRDFYDKYTRPRLEFVVTDACWRALESLAETARENIREWLDAEPEARISASPGAIHITVEK